VKGSEGPGRLGEELAGFLDRKGLAKPLAQQGALLDWSSRVGAGISGVTRPRSLSGGTLVVEVRTSAWLMELNLMKREVLERLNQGREGVPVERLVFVLAETP
jgi:predicted nucleic acid-binding Zn ribbon protein